MDKSVVSSAALGSRGAASSAPAAWVATLGELESWLGLHAQAIWPTQGEQQASKTMAGLRHTLDGMARGEEVIARMRPGAPSWADAPRIDTLLAGKRVGSQSRPDITSAQRRQAILNLGLWNALRSLPPDPDGATGTPALTRLHAELSAPLPPAPGVSPAPSYASSDAAGRFFDGPVRAVLGALAEKTETGGAGYAGAVPSQPFDAGLPSLVAWSQAWSVAVAGVYLDYLCRHARDGLPQLLRDLWSGRLDAVRFRPSAGLAVLPTHDGALHLDLWTCMVKAQALSFDAARGAAHAAGVRWHGVRIDMHDLSGTARNEAAGTKKPSVATGLSVESLYRTVFIDRLLAVLGARGPHESRCAYPSAHAAEHLIAIDMDKPRDGQLQNLRLLLRWRDPSTGPLRLVPSDAEAGLGRAGHEAVQRWLARQADDTMAHALATDRIDWHAAPTPPGEDCVSAGELLALGHGALWHALGAAAQWVDPALVICTGHEWYELPVVVHDMTAAAEAGVEERSWWLLPAACPLPGGLDVATLREATRAAGTLRWVAHEVGLGAFVMAAIDVDAWRRSR